jgi:hypothetical protein
MARIPHRPPTPLTWASSTIMIARARAQRRGLPHGRHIAVHAEGPSVITRRLGKAVVSSSFSRVLTSRCGNTLIVAGSTARRR